MFEGKVVWITGASSGIGLAFARALHAQGARLIVSSLNLEELKPVSDELEGVFPLAFDVSNFDALPTVVDKANSAFGRIDVLINNAGIVQRSLAVDTSIDVYRKVIDVDLMGPIVLTQLVIPQMLERKQGRIIAISSVAGKFGAPLRSAYCSAKHGVFGYFDSLRAEVDHLGVSVHVVGPGAVRTNLARNALTGSGSRYGVSDKFIEDGFEPRFFVERVLSKIRSGKNEIIIARGLEYKIYLLRRLFPELAIKAVLKASQRHIDDFRKTYSE